MEGFSDSTKRVRPSAKRLDLTELRKALEDGRVWAGLGLVWQPPGEPSHFDLEPDQSGNGTDVLVHVQKMPNQEPLLARLGCLSTWRIPPVGAEVALLIPDGDYDAGAIITAVLSTGAPPAALDGDTLASESPKINLKATAGDAELDASGNVVLGGGTLAAIIGSTDFDTWITNVSSFINGLVPGTVVPPTAHKSAKVKA